MFVEFCPKAVDDRQDLVRIYGGSHEEFATLRAAMRRLAAGSERMVDVHALPGFVPVDGVRVVARLGTESLGVRATDQPSSFEVVLDEQGWAEAADSAEPVAEDLGIQAYNWLTEVGEIELLISVTGHW